MINSFHNQNNFLTVLLLLFAARTARAQDSNENPIFKGFYIQANWILTGESFNYTQGKFLRIRPQSPRGAWEAAVRFSRVDLNDEGVRGGEAKNLTIAVNWYAPGNQFHW